jgi:hypothetical protein
MIIDRHDDPGRAGLQCPGQGQEGLYHHQGAHEAEQEVVQGGAYVFDGKGNNNTITRLRQQS